MPGPKPPPRPPPLFPPTNPPNPTEEEEKESLPLWASFPLSLVCARQPATLKTSLHLLRAEAHFLSGPLQGQAYLRDSTLLSSPLLPSISSPTFALPFRPSSPTSLFFLFPLPSSPAIIPPCVDARPHPSQPSRLYHSRRHPSTRISKLLVVSSDAFLVQPLATPPPNNKNNNTEGYRILIGDRGVAVVFRALERLSSLYQQRPLYQQYNQYPFTPSIYRL